MEKFLNPYDKQCMRMAMLKHEETFKQQVYELHRLYQNQKILMKDMKIKNLTPKENNVNSLGTFIRRVDQPETFSDGNNNIEIMDESKIELTLGPSCYGDNDLMRTNKKIKKNSLSENMDADLDSGRWSLSSSSTGSNNNNNNNNLDEQVRQERFLKHQKQNQPWLQALTLNVI